MSVCWVCARFPERKYLLCLRSTDSLATMHHDHRGTWPPPWVHALSDLPACCAGLLPLHAHAPSLPAPERGGDGQELARGSSLFTHYKYSRSGKRPNTETTDTVRCPIKNCTGLHLEILVYDLN